MNRSPLASTANPPIRRNGDEVAGPPVTGVPPDPVPATMLKVPFTTFETTRRPMSAM